MSLIKTIIIGIGLLIVSTAGAGWVGTGVLISNEGHILTNKHVAQAKEYTVFYNNKPVYARLHKLDSQNDLAIIKVNELTPCLKVTPNRGNKLYLLSFTDGSKLPIRKQAVRTKTYDEYILGSDREFRWSDTLYESYVVAGNSGSPVVNEYGEVQRLVWGGRKTTPTSVVSNGYILTFTHKITCTYPVKEWKKAVVFIYHD